MTMTRWHKPMSSCISDEITITERPCSASASDEAVDLLLVADIDAAGRLVDDHDPGLGQHHLGKQQLLLVAAGQFARKHIATPRAADVEITNGCIKRCILSARRR